MDAVPYPRKRHWLPWLLHYDSTASTLSYCCVDGDLIALPRRPYSARTRNKGVYFKHVLGSRRSHGIGWRCYRVARALLAFLAR